MIVIATYVCEMLAIGGYGRIKLGDFTKTRQTAIKFHAKNINHSDYKFYAIVDAYHFTHV